MGTFRARPNEIADEGWAKVNVRVPSELPSTFGGMMNGATPPGPTNVLNVASVEADPLMAKLKVTPFRLTPFSGWNGNSSKVTSWGAAHAEPDAMPRSPTLHTVKISLFSISFPS